ncbi:hypothetical protein Ct9H90mP29_13120 [bacterium]|nr:MAG: hypothetical protein Ct9H90mP29_13120 [bacterium]
MMRQACLKVNDIFATIISNGSEVDNCNITSLTLTDSNFLIGGETSIESILSIILLRMVMSISY